MLWKEKDMKRLVIFTLVVAVPLLTACCPIPDISGLIPASGEFLEGSGTLVTEEYALTGFDKVDASHAFTVDITQGDTFSVVVSIDDNLAQYLRVEKQGSTLRIGLSPGRNYRAMTATADVTMPELTGLELSGASHGSVSGFDSTEGLTVQVSGASHLTGDIEAGDVRFSVSGASRVTLSGSAQAVVVDVSGASHVDLADFPVADADVEASGASTVTVSASGTLDANASGASHVKYLGSPSLGSVETSGASSVERE
jgi:hypothetical protein